MAVIHDMIPNLEVFQPRDVDGALELLGRHRKDAWAVAGGLDTYDWLKDRAKRPKVLVDLGGIEELHGIRELDDGVEIGALTTLTEVERSPLLRERYPLLAEAAASVATPQIRNQASLGGNLCQDTRCWYYRGGWPCYRAGGNICYADSSQSMNREHALFGANRCVAASPTDVGPAAIALDALAVIRGPRGERVVAAENFFIGPAVDITRMTVLQPNEILVSVRLPVEWAGTSYYFEKAKDRQSWDFALCSVSAAIKVEDRKVRDARIAVGAVAPFPLRLRNAEKELRGQALGEEIAERAGKLAVFGARPLRQNGFKVALMRNLVKRAIRDLNVV